MNALNQTKTVLLQPDRASQIFIVVLAVIQASLLYLVQTGQEQQWAIFTKLHGVVYWYSLVLAVPTVMLLSVQHWLQRAFWFNIGLVTLLYAGMATWAIYNATGAPGIEASAVLTPYGTTQAILLFLLLPFLQSRLLNDSWQWHYPQLFSLAWQNTFTLVLMLVFTGLCWLVLHLGASLFALINLTFLETLLRERAVIYLLTGLMVGLGLLLGRTQHSAVTMLRNIVFAMFKGLLPLLSIIAIAFVLSLPFTGLEPLWATKHAASILLCLQLTLLVFVNAVAQTGEQPSPYPAVLRYLTQAALGVLPVFALLTLYAIYLRLAQYGMTQERFYALLLACVLAVHAIGYCYAAIRSTKHWLPWLGHINIGVAVVTIALLLLSNSPLLDPHRLTVQSQLPRLQASTAEQPSQGDLFHLRFSSGRTGYQALQQLQTELADDNALAIEIAEALTKAQRYQPYLDDEQLSAAAITDLALLKLHIVSASSVERVDDTFWQALLVQKLGMINCLQSTADCILLQQDLDNDNQPELVLCDNGRRYGGISCQVYVFNSQWQPDAAFYISVSEQSRRQVRIQLLEQALQLKPRRYPDLQIDDQTIQIRLISE